MTLTLIDLIIGILATWRISSMLSNERGPYAMFQNLREFLGILHDDEGEKIGIANTIQGLQKELALLVDCPLCSSIWIGLVFMIMYCAQPSIGLFIMLPFALSAGVIILGELNYT